MPRADLIQHEMRDQDGVKNLRSSKDLIACSNVRRLDTAPHSGIGGWNRVAEKAIPEPAVMRNDISHFGQDIEVTFQKRSS
jgi:hypothetical protein